MEKAINKPKSAPAPSCVYLMGIIGAAIYYISQASTFWMGVVGFLKAFIWPVLLVFETLKHLAI
jgi:hypothetical protein